MVWFFNIVLAVFAFFVFWGIAAETMKSTKICYTCVFVACVVIMLLYNLIGG